MMDERDFNMEKVETALQARFNEKDRYQKENGS